jgi:hypothetical protein
MYKASVVAGSVMLAVFFLVSSAYSQIDSQNKPLGDVAREQKEVRKQEQKNEESGRVLTNDDVASRSTADAESPAEPSTSQGSQTAASNDATENAQSAGGENQGKQSERPPAGSILDRPEDSTPDVIVVPAGTELKVDLDAGKTVVPVRVGFATPIPALSQVSVQVSRTAVSVPYLIDGTVAMSYVDFLEYATVTAVTVGGKTYDVQSNTLPLSQGGTNSELRFILAGPVSIER